MKFRKGSLSLGIFIPGQHTWPDEQDQVCIPVSTSPLCPGLKTIYTTCTVALEVGEVGTGVYSFILPLPNRAGTSISEEINPFFHWEAGTQFTTEKLNFSQLMYKRQNLKKRQFQKYFCRPHKSAGHMKIIYIQCLEFSFFITLPKYFNTKVSIKYV